MIKGDVLSVVDSFYAAASGDGEWSDAVGRFKRLLGFPGATFRIYDQRRARTLLRIWDGLDENLSPLFDAYYATISPGERFVNEHPDARIVWTYLYTPEAELDRDEWFTWKMREMGLCYSIAGVTRPGPPFRAQAPLHRPRSAGHPTHDEIALYTRIFDHIQRAVILAWRLDGAPLGAADADLLLERRPNGVVLLDRAGRVLFANRAARTMAARDDAFALSGEAITALRKTDDETLQGLIASAARADSTRPLRRGGAMRLPRRSGKRDYAVLVTPLPGRSGPFASVAPAIAVTIADPAASISSGTILRDLYGLTAAELKVAERVALGETPREAAAGLGIAVKTVREHISALLRKTETRRQAELVRLVDTATASGLPGI